MLLKSLVIPLLVVISTLAICVAHEPNYEDEEEMEALFAKHGFDDMKKRGGVMCHSSMASVQSKG